jgi:hypothetical protein
MPESIPAWLTVLSDDELALLKRFLLQSGSLKALAADYGVTYPTIRARLDRLIAKVESTDIPDSDNAFDRLLAVLVQDGVMAPGTARSLRLAHKRVVSDAAQRAERHGAANALLPPGGP